MSRLYSKVKTFMRAEDGPTTVEYAVLLALMVGMMVGSIWYVREQAVGLSSDVVTGMDDALNN